MSFVKSRRGLGAAVAGAVTGTAVASSRSPRTLCCPVCGAEVRFPLVGPRLKCPVCGKVSALARWSLCERPPIVIDTYETQPTFYPFWRGGGGGGHHHGGGGHHGHHGFGDDTLSSSAMPTPGSQDEQVALLRRVANAQEGFNRQDLVMRRYQLAATVALPVLAATWGQIAKWWKGRRGDGLPKL